MRIAVLIIPALIFLGCASAPREGAVSLLSEKAISSVSAEEQVSGKERIIIFNAYMEIEVESPEKAAADISAIAVRLSGYTVSSGSTRSVIRVPSGKFSDALKSVSLLGDVVSKRIYSEDVTEKYRDTSIRLENKLKARDRYLQLLKKAENVTAALKVERELERLNGEIESLKGKIKRYAHLARFSTITVKTEEKVKPGPLGYIFWGAWKAVKWLFVRN